MTKTKDDFGVRVKELRERLHPRSNGRDSGCEFRDCESLGKRLDGTFETGAPSDRLALQRA
jgi:hypothetical protein